MKNFPKKRSLRHVPGKMSQESHFLTGCFMLSKKIRDVQFGEIVTSTIICSHLFGSVDTKKQVLVFPPTQIGPNLPKIYNFPTPLSPSPLQDLKHPPWER